MKHLGFLGLAFLLTTQLAAAAAENNGSAAKTQVVLCDATTVFLVPTKITLWPSPPPGQSYRVEVFKLAESLDERLSQPGATRLGEVTATLVEKGNLLRASFNNPLPGDSSLAVRVTLGPASGERTLVASGEFSTKAEAAMRLSGADAETGYRFEVTSNTPLAFVPGDLVLVETLQPKANPDAPKTRTHPVNVMTASDAVDCEEPPPVTFGGSSGLIVDLAGEQRLRRSSVAVALGCPGAENGSVLACLKDIFDQPVMPKGDIPPPKPPKGKDDATYFLNALFESAQDSESAFSVDAKAQPTFRLYGRWLFRPELTASFAKNVPKASNSLRLAALASRTELWDSHQALRGYTLSVGPSLEADRNLDRVNAVVDFRWRPELKGLYHTREVRRLRNASEDRIDPKKLALPPWGWGLDLWLGIEAGSSIREQTVKNKAGTATLEIPGYDVARLRAQFHAFVEYKRLTLDVSSGLRYLTSEELRAKELEDGTLVLEQIDDSRPYTQASLSVGLDQTKNLSLALVYKNGSEPPLFEEIDKLSIGLVAKY